MSQDEAAQQPMRVVSLGYEGRSIDEFVATLADNDVSVVVDVRLTARSRKPGFSKSAMSDALGDAGLQYVHESDLGNPTWNREPFWNGDVEAGCSVYRGVIADAQEAITRVMSQVSKGSVALVCFERDHRRCHRQVVVDVLREAEPTLDCVPL